MNLGPRLKHLNNRRKVLRTAKRKHPMKEEPKYTQPFWAGWMWWALFVLCLPLGWFIATIFYWKVRPWTDLLWFPAMWAGLLVFRYFQRKGIEKRVNNLPTSPRYHRNDVTGEGTTRPYWKASGFPIANISLWYQMTRECGEREAEIALDRNEAELTKEHTEYLNSF